jgi:hypothetical protein
VRIESLQSVVPFVTKDGSAIRELAGVPTGNSENQSLAEATVPPGGETEEHYHRASEEIYFFTHGRGRLLTAVFARGHVPNRVVETTQTRYRGWRMDTEASRQPLGTEDERTGLMMVELSNAMVRLYKDLFGRGPTKAKTNIDARAQPDSHRATHGCRG